MAVKASNEVTVIDQTDAKDLVTWYQLSTSAIKPNKPTTTSASATPSGWTKAEPSYDPSQGTKYLYTCQQLVWGDNTCSWGDVQLSSSYEAAKAAVNAAAAASAATDAISNAVGVSEPPYTEVEWVESNGKQYVYLDWKPPIATWGFEADFIIRNAFSLTAGAWNASTNVNGYGNVFGTRNASVINDIQLGTYSTYGLLRWGSSAYTSSGLLKQDKTRQQVSLKGTSLKCGNGTTVTVTRSTEDTSKPYANMTIFGMHEGLRRSGTDLIAQPGTVRIYSLKFYESTTQKVDLVGAIRKSDGTTGLYDKIARHFYPAPGMTYGSEVGDLGEPDTLERRIAKENPSLSVNNLTDRRMWRANAPMIDRLEDGQQITVTPEYTVVNSVQTTNLPGWDDTTSNGNVYLKLTLADGTDTDWIPCWYGPVTRLTSHYGAGIPVRLSYRENATGNSTDTATNPVLRGWFADPNYVDGNTTYTKYSDSVIAGKNGLRRYTLCMRDDEGNWTSIVNEANNVNATGKTCYTGGLLLGGVGYHSTAVEYAAGANAGTIWESNGGIDFRYSVNGVTTAAATTTLQLRKPIYLVGTIGTNDNLFYLDTTKWWTQEPNDSSKVYVLVGTAYSSYYAIFMATVNPAYVVRDGELVEITDSRFVDVNAELVRQADSIALKANAANVYTKESTNALLEVKANKETLTSEINASADTVKIDASRVNIEGAAIFTSGRLSQTSLNNAYDTKGAAASAQNAAISTASADATTKANAAETNAKAYTDALEIGGRNLLKYSRDYSQGYGGTKTGAFDGIDGTYQQCTVWKHTKSQTSSYEEALSTSTSIVSLWTVGPDEDYVLSFWAKASANLSIYSYFYYSGNNTCDLAETSTGYKSSSSSDGSAITNIGTEWARYWVHWHFNSSTDPTKHKNLIVARMQPSVTGTIWIAGPKLEKGNKATDWTPAPEDVDANAVKRTQRIWYRKSASGAPATPGTASSNWVTKADDGNDAWTKMHIAISSTHKYIYTCEQYEMANGTVGYTSVLLDNTITVIDGGNIITGSVSANAVNASSGTFDVANIPVLNSSKINVDSITQIGPSNGNHVVIDSGSFDFVNNTTDVATLELLNSDPDDVQVNLRLDGGFGNNFLSAYTGQVVHDTSSDTTRLTSSLAAHYYGTPSASDGQLNLSSMSVRSGEYCSDIYMQTRDITVVPIKQPPLTVYNASLDNLGHLISCRAYLAGGDITIPANGGASATWPWQGSYIAGTGGNTAVSFPDTNYIVVIGKSGNGQVNGFDKVDFMVTGKTESQVTIAGWNSYSQAVTIHVVCIGFNSRYGTRA